MAVNTLHFEIRHTGGTGIHLWGFGNVDAELVLFQARGNVGMGTGINIRVHPQRNRCLHAELARHGIEPVQFGVGFDIETAYAHLERPLHFPLLLADAGEDHPGWVATGFQHPLQLTGRNNIEAGTESGQNIQHGQIAVGFYRVAHQMRMIPKGIVVGPIVPLERRAGVYIGRSAKTIGNGRDRDILGVELAVAVVEMIHEFPDSLYGVGRPACYSRFSSLSDGSWAESAAEFADAA